MKLYVVRHAAPVVEPSVPPERWRLSEEGAAAARALALGRTWDGVARLYHSPEAKVAKTAAAFAQVLGVATEAAADLREVTMRAGFLPDREFERRVSAYLGGSSDAEFEPYDEARDRVVTCVARLVRVAAGRPVAVVSHGRILTVLFSALCGVRLGGADWRSIGMPDLAVVDLAAGRVEAGFFAGRRIDQRVILA